MVLLLNADYTPLQAITWRRAVKLIYMGKVDIVQQTDQVIGRFRLPSVLRLVHLVRSVFKRQVGWSKRNVLIRDRNRCQYCGKLFPKKQLTLDHVVPKSCGGKNKWTNTVAACFPCNNAKGNRTPAQAGLHLYKKPVEPTLFEFMKINLGDFSYGDLMAAG